MLPSGKMMDDGNCNGEGNGLMQHHQQQEQEQQRQQKESKDHIGDNNCENEHELIMNDSEVSTTSCTTTKTNSTCSSTSSSLPTEKIEVQQHDNKEDKEIEIVSNSIGLLSLLVMIPISVTSLSFSSPEVLFFGLSSSSSWVSSKVQSISSMQLSLYISVLVLIVVLSGIAISDKMVVYKGGGAPFWRVLYSVMILYNVLLTALYLFPSRETARNDLFQLFFNDIGPLEVFQDNVNESIAHVMKSCAINGTTLYRQIFVAPWFWCHIIGWTIKTFIFRDFYMCLFAGAMFEIWEVSLGYVVPEFEECWWDSLFLDYLMGNLGGIIIGCTLLKCVNMELYNWSGCTRRGASTTKATTKNMTKHDQNSNMGIHENSNNKNSNYKIQSDNSTSFPLHLFSPFTSSDYVYDVFYNPTRLMQYISTAFLMCLAELNIFNMVNTMGTPHGSLYTHFRMLSVTFLGLPLGYEYYRYTEGKWDGLGIAFFLMVWMNMLEIMVTYRFFPPHMQSAVDSINNPFKMPATIVTCHAISLVLFFVWFVLRYYFVKYDVRDNEGNNENKYNILIDDMDTEEMKIVNRILSEDKERKEKQQTSTPWYKNFIQLPPNLQRHVILVESINVLLLLSMVPQCYILCDGWKWN